MGTGHGSGDELMVVVPAEGPDAPPGAHDAVPEGAAAAMAVAVAVPMEMGDGDDDDGDDDAFENAINRVEATFTPPRAAAAAAVAVATPGADVSTAAVAAVPYSPQPLPLHVDKNKMNHGHDAPDPFSEAAYLAALALSDHKEQASRGNSSVDGSSVHHGDCGRQPREVGILLKALAPVTYVPAAAAAAAAATGSSSSSSSSATTSGRVGSTFATTYHTSAGAAVTGLSFHLSQQSYASGRHKDLKGLPDHHDGWAVAQDAATKSVVVHQLPVDCPVPEKYASSYYGNKPFLRTVDVAVGYSSRYHGPFRREDRMETGSRSVEYLAPVRRVAVTPKATNSEAHALAWAVAEPYMRPDALATHAQVGG